MSNHHGRMSTRFRGPQRCAICREIKPKTRKVGNVYYCEEHWRKKVK